VNETSSADDRHAPEKMAKTYKKGGGGDVMATFQKQMMSAVTEVAKESQGQSQHGKGVAGWDLMGPDVFGADAKKKKSGKARDVESRDFFDGTPDQEPDRVEGDDEDWELDDDDGLEQMRLARLEQMKQQHKETMELKAKGHGEYTEIDESQFLKEVTSSQYVVCHFYHKDFESCKTFDDRLRTLSKKFVRTKFIYIDADKAPFFVQKLAIRILPCLVCFKDGIAVERLIGTMELGNCEDFSAALLALRLAEKGCLEYEGNGDDLD
jgi:thiol-disulfide isomerase/thioredoxin